MVSGNLSKFGDNAGSLPVIGKAQTGFRIGVANVLGDANRNHGQDKRHYGACPADAYGMTAPLPPSQVTERLYKDDKQRASGWRRIVRQEPSHR